MKKIFLTLFFVFLISNTTFAADCESMTDIFWKYQCRVEKVCKQYDENKKVFNPEKYKEASIYKETEVWDILMVSSTEQKPIKKAVSIYKENMNSTYKCAMIWVQKNSLLNIKQKLLKFDKTWDIKKSIEPKIQELTNKLDMIWKSSSCLSIDKNTIFNKLSILRQTTYLTCDFSFYWEYLKEYYKDLNNSTENKKWENKEYSITQTAKMLDNIQNGISNEVNQAYKTFPLAFNAYSEYENNFPIHFLLELIKEDYNILRNKLHETINPINQVVYKISNAMIK